MASVDGLFENGPQRVQTTTEAEFSRQFVSMLGNVPRLVGFISAGVFVAILLAVVNTMLMSAREQMHDVGILKALGFTDGATGRLLLLQSLSMCTFGGGLGIVLALAMERPIGAAMGRMFPGYAIEPATLIEAAVVTIGVGLLAGLVPAWNARRLKSVDALRPH
jgi:putative ABC transport system permease protein